MYMQQVRKYFFVELSLSYSHIMCYFSTILLSTSTIANKVLQNLKTNKITQSILVSGTSGSGKTETIKHITKFLCNVNMNDAAKTIRQHIIDSNHILESFGNARTENNRNSSRYFKHMEV